MLYIAGTSPVDIMHNHDRTYRDHTHLQATLPTLNERDPTAPVPTTTAQSYTLPTLNIAKLYGCRHGSKPHWA